ncbi:unnamed protein product [Chrysoparadoxa australica]
MPALGFGGRCPRDRYRAGGVVQADSISNEHLGPGTYDVAPEKGRGEQSPAPFLSTSTRHLGASPEGADLPAPGSYVLPPTIKINRSKSSNVFRSGTQRFKEKRSSNQTPGPGTYNVSGALGNAEKGRKAKDGSKVQWVRIPTAPSIPGRTQSYGYAEGAQGELVMQHPADQGCTGVGSDCRGPMYYRPKVDATKAKLARGVDFSKGPDRLALMEATRRTQAPGPGHYHPASESGPSSVGEVTQRPRKRPMHTAAFKSSTQRSNPSAAAGPGPGTYKLPSSIDAATARRPNAPDLSFLCTSERFSDPYGRHTGALPGPGSYENPSGFGGGGGGARGRQRRRQRSGSAPVGFASTSLRFMQPKGASDEVGPAAYNIPTMTDEVKKRLTGKHGVFGSTSKRFPQKGPQPEATSQSASASAPSQVALGPSRARGTVRGGGAVRTTALSSFASKSQRFASGSACHGPSPGQYYHPSRWDESGKGVLPMGKSSGERFAGAKASGIGPAGSYELTVQDKKHSSRSKGVIGGSQARFSTPGAFKNCTPGPGSYSCGGEGLLKSTYNIAIAEGSTDMVF